MTKQEIQKILALHEEWLQDSDKGKKADLTGADLTGANLEGANLKDATLACADLRGANLEGALIRLTPEMIEMIKSM